jgi:hypothetical protein
MRFAVPALAAFILLYAAASNAQQLDPWQLVGHTTTTHLGDAGLKAFNLACQADFGAAAKMCTSQEVIETIVQPTLSSEAWVRPVIIAVSDHSFATDFSGVATSLINLNCWRWQVTNSGYSGLIVTTDGNVSFFISNSVVLPVCDTPRPVACCRRVPEPTASLMLPVGGLACLGLAKARS